MLDAYDLTTHLGAYLYEKNHFSLNGCVGFVTLQVLRGFADASGKDTTLTDRVLAVNGCLGTPDKWARFDGEWQAFLESERFIREYRFQRFVFHTSKFWNGSCPFMPSHLKKPNTGTFAEKQRIYRHLVGLVSKYQECAFGYAVLLKDFWKLEDDFPHVRQIILGKPGTLLAGLSIHWNSVWAGKHPSGFNESIDYIFDQGDEFLGELDKQFQRALKHVGSDGLNVSDFAWCSSAKYSPLQAADIVAWECNHYWRDRFIDPVRSLAARLPPSREFEMLISDPEMIRCYDYSHLKKEMVDNFRETFLPDLQKELKIVGSGKPFASLDDLIRATLIATKAALDKEKVEAEQRRKMKKTMKQKKLEMKDDGKGAERFRAILETVVNVRKEDLKKEEERQKKEKKKA